MSEIGLAVKRLRAAMGLSQAKFADAMHVGLATVQRWESGESVPSSALVNLYFAARKVDQKDIPASIFVTGPSAIDQAAAEAGVCRALLLDTDRHFAQPAQRAAKELALALRDGDPLQRKLVTDVNRHIDGLREFLKENS